MDVSRGATYARHMSSQSNSSDTSWNEGHAYDCLPPLPPAVELETKRVLKRCVTARAALGELKQATALIPNPTMLVNTLPALEARASAEIENIVTTTDRVFQQMGAGRALDEATTQALASRSALLDGFALLATRPIGTRTAEVVGSAVLGHELRVRHGEGTALASQATGRIVYVPPEGEARVRDLLANWERFLHEALELDPLVRMAVGHYQFEAIHPFTDGNGRTGRILNVLYLVEQELLPLPILHLSRAINASRAEYSDGLLAVTTAGAWEAWLLYMLRCVEETATWTTRLITAIQRLSDHTAAYVRTRRPKIYSRELVDVLFEQPYCRIRDVVAAGLVGRQAASRHLKALVGIGVLREETHGRERLFVHPKLMALLTGEADTFEAYES